MHTYEVHRTQGGIRFTREIEAETPEAAAQAYADDANGQPVALTLESQSDTVSVYRDPELDQLYIVFS